MKLSQFSGSRDEIVSDNPLRTLVLQEMIKNAPILDLVEFYSMQGGLTDVPAKELDRDTSGVEFRTLNDDYSAPNGNPQRGLIEIKTLGGVVKTDDIYVAAGGDQGVGEHLREVRRRARAMARLFEDSLINGSTADTPSRFNGFKTLCPTSQKITFDPDGDGVLSAPSTGVDYAKSKTFIEALDYLCDMIEDGATCLVMSPRMKNRLKTYASQNFESVSAQDSLGANRQIQYFTSSSGNIPIITTGYTLAHDADRGASVIDQTETALEDDRTGCTSIYAVKFGERMDFAMGTFVGLIAKAQGKVDNFIKSRVELHCGSDLLDTYALARLDGIVIQ